MSVFDPKRTFGFDKLANRRDSCRWIKALGDHAANLRLVCATLIVGQALPVIDSAADRWMNLGVEVRVKRYCLALGLGMWSALAPQPVRAQVDPETYHFVCMSGPWVQSNNITGLVAYGVDPVTAKFQTYAEAVAYEELLEKRFEAQAEKVGQLQYAGRQALATCSTHSATSLENPDRRIVFESYLVDGPGYETIGNQRMPIKRANIPKGWETIAAPSEEESGESSEAGAPMSQRGHIVIQDRKPTAAASAPEAPLRPKKSNAQADAEYAAALAVYERQMAAHRQQVEDHERAQDDFARTKEEQRLAAEKVLAAHRKEIEKAEAAQLEYRKELAKPAGVPNAIYRGFTGRSCDDARRSAVGGAGTTAGTQFREVRSEMSESGTCLVQGWWWTTGKGGASRQ